MLSQNHLLHDHGIQLIGISGNSGSGKDTVADYIESLYTDVFSESFADPLKQACAVLFGIRGEDFYLGNKKEVVNPYWGVSPRQIAQFVGTELFRDNIYKLCPLVKDGFWFHRLYAKLSGEQRNTDIDGDYCSGDTVVIPDVRFQNEFEWILNHGGIVICLHRMSATGEVGIVGHRSEQIYRPHGNVEGVYHVANNGTLEELYALVKASLDASHLSFIPKSIVNNI